MKDYISDPPQFNVVVSNGGKFYHKSSSSKHVIFSQVNLTLPPGTVYGLLGPSGCGKTTLLKCILGRLHLDQGTISLFGHWSGAVTKGITGPNIGYMPQDTCIPNTLTIGECWAYYGAIAGLREDKIAKAIKYFISLLNLPSANTINSSLSGGELRRVAFGTALIHEPKLLILDEPTVGIDCITKKKMLDHLLNLAAKKGTSIILTTHYIEEARVAHKIGLMQGGTLAIEDRTENLLRNSGCSSLEEVFLKICEDSSVIAQMQSNIPDVVVPANVKKRLGGNFDDFFFRLFVLKAVIRKNFIHLYRFPGILLFAAFLPCIQISMSVMTYGTFFSHIRMAVVNEDLGNMGLQYLTFLKNDLVDLDFFNSSANAMKALHTGDVKGLIDIGQNFSNAYLERTMVVTSLVVKSTFINDSRVSVLLDNISFEINSLLRMHVMTSFGKFLHATYTSLGLNSRIVQPVITFDESAIEFLSQPNSINQRMSLIVMASFFVAAAISITNIYVEKNCGYLERSIIAGLKPCELILGVIIPLMAVLGVQIALITAFSCYTVLHEINLEGICLLYAVLFCLGLCGIAFGIALSLFVNQTYMLLCSGSAILIFSGSITGGCVPLSSAPAIYQYVILALPMAFPLKAISAIYFKKVFTHMAVMSSLASSLSWILVFLTVSMLILKINH